LAVVEEVVVTPLAVVVVGQLKLKLSMQIQKLGR
jgi:hypothetical protein